MHISTDEHALGFDPADSPCCMGGVHSNILLDYMLNNGRVLHANSHRLSATDVLSNL